MSRIFFALLKKEFLIISKDLQALLALFVLPIAFILILSYALKDISNPNKHVSCSYFIDLQNESLLVEKFDEQMQSFENFKCNKTNTNTPNTKDDIFISIPNNFFDDFAKKDTLFSQINIFYKPSLNSALINLFKTLFTQKIAFLYLDENDEFTPLFVTNLQKNFINQTPFGDKTPNSVEQSVPSWIVFAMYFILLPISTVLITEKQQGTYNRLKSLKLSPFLFFTSKALTYNIINILQGFLMIFVGIYVVKLIGLEPLRIENYLAISIMIFSLSISAIGFAFFIVALSKSSAQSVIIGGLSIILIGSISGIMVPKIIMPHTLKLLSNFSPMSWALDGFLDIFLYNSDVFGIAKYALLLIFFGITLFFISIVILSKRKED